MESLNLYGDSQRPTTGTHGADITSQRMDELDRECLRFVLGQAPSPVTAADLGCGLGTQSFRLGSLGASVWMYDLLDIREPVLAFNRIMRADRLRFFQQDLANVAPEDVPERLSVLYSQRFIHYLRFDAAAKVLRLFAQRMPGGARAFLSASGLRTELGDGYPHALLPVEDRHAPLGHAVAGKHQIHEPVCLYEEEDLAKLAAHAGLKPVSVTRSSFGNIKGVFTKEPA